MSRTSVLIGCYRLDAYDYDDMLGTSCAHAFTLPKRNVMPSQFKSVDQIMSNETIKCCFGHVVEKFLCGESYWFLNEVSVVRHCPLRHVVRPPQVVPRLLILYNKTGAKSVHSNRMSAHGRSEGFDGRKYVINIPTNRRVQYHYICTVP